MFKSNLPNDEALIPTPDSSDKKARGVIHLTGKKIRRNIQIKEDIDLTCCDLFGSLRTLSEATLFEVRTKGLITVKDKLCALRSKLGSIQGRGELDLQESVIHGDCEGEDVVSLSGCHVIGRILGKAGVNIRATRVTGAVLAYTFNGENSEIDVLKARSFVRLRETSILKRVATDSSLRADDCKHLGEVAAKEKIVLSRCLGITSVKSCNEVSLEDCTVGQDVSVKGQARVVNSVIHGMLKGGEKNLFLSGSTVGSIVVTGGENQVITLDGSNVLGNIFIENKGTVLEIKNGAKIHGRIVRNDEEIVKE